MPRTAEGRDAMGEAGNDARRVVAKIEWHKGELFPRVGFVVTNLRRPSWRVVKFYNSRGTAEQWIKEGKNAVKWTRLSCHDFVDNQGRRRQSIALSADQSPRNRTWKQAQLS